MEDLFFLSYSRKDTKQMHEIKKYLSDIGFNVWIDEKIEPGTPVWEKAIENAIKNSLAFIVLLSPASKESIWVRREIHYAEIFGVPKYPILIKGDIKTSIPISVITTQRIDVTKNFKKEMQKLVITFERQGWNTKKLELPQTATDPGQISKLAQDQQFLQHFVMVNTRWRLLGSLDPIRFNKVDDFNQNKASAKLDIILTILFGQGIVVPNSYLIDSPAFIENAYEIINYSRKDSVGYFAPLRLSYFDLRRRKTNPFEIASFMLQNERFILSNWPKLSQDKIRRLKWGQYISNKEIIPKCLIDSSEQEIVEKLYYVLNYFDTHSENIMIAMNIGEAYNKLFKSLVNLDALSFTNMLSGLSKNEKAEIVSIIRLVKDLAKSGFGFDSRSRFYSEIDKIETILSFKLSETELPIIKKKTVGLFNTLYGFIASISTGSEYYNYEDDNVIRELSTYAINYFRDFQFSASEINGSINSDLRKKLSEKNRGIMFVQNLSWEKIFNFIESSKWRNSLISYIEELNNYEALVNYHNINPAKQSANQKSRLILCKNIYEEACYNHLDLIISFFNELR